jgi:hypothetical protein
MNQQRIATAQPKLIEDQALESQICKGSNLMTEEKGNLNQLVLSELEVSGKFESVEEARITNQVSKENVMFDLELESLVEVEFADHTFDSEQELAKFLETLTEAQLRDTEVLVDDGSFVVFFPLLVVPAELPGKTSHSGYHFDTDAPRPTVPSAEVPELVGLLAEQFPFPTEPVTTKSMREILASVLI